MGCVPPPYGRPTAGGAREGPLCSRLSPTAVPRTSGVPWCCRDGRSLIPNWDGAPQWQGPKGTLGKPRQCSSAAGGNTVREGHPLGLAHPEGKISPLECLKGPSNAAFCLWLGHRKAATTKLCSHSQWKLGLVSQYLVLQGMLVCKPLMSL